MKNAILTAAILLSASISFAATISEKTVGLFQGEELVNEHSTGKACYIYVDYVKANTKGRHCYDLTTRPVFSTDRDTHPKYEIIVQSRITNYHRSEYPAVKTCAMSLDGRTSDNDIYEVDTTNLYNQIFSWEAKHEGYQFDFFVTFSPETKLPVRTRLHKMNWTSEKDYECINLQKL